MSDLTVSDFVHGESDPADYNAPVVVEYLTGPGADPAEFARVQELEATGRNRVSITGLELEAVQEDAADQADDRPQEGDTLPDQEDGYTRVVVSS
jgi:hypothetical protein